MARLLDDYDYHLTPLDRLEYQDAPVRLKAFRDWLLATPATKEIHERLYARINAAGLFRHVPIRGGRTEIIAATPDEIAVVGFDFIKMLAERIMEPAQLIHEYGIRAAGSGESIQPKFSELMRRYIGPALAYLRRELAEAQTEATVVLTPGTANGAPVEIAESLARLRHDHPEPAKVAFIMMRFGQTSLHGEIIATIRQCLAKMGLTALRADDKQYHDDLFANVNTYMHGCSFGIAVFERLEVEAFNPNVALEVGYMQALRKPVCLLKDRSLQSLHADLIGKLYRSFDPHSPAATIPPELEKWLHDKNLARRMDPVA